MMFPYQGTNFILTIKNNFHGKLHVETQYDLPEVTRFLGTYKFNHEQ